ncbi:MAG: 16S rRNA (uracil(1498)-N(3))-methyltransferase [Oscillospiraceae bacterium]|nr:16S rRNA (uracil(1498)-N(3))-methyltransferase [Oscillospiraceae bacterium]
MEIIMPKFFTARENISDTQIVIDNEDVNHISRVLRMNIGDEITVCDGRGFDYKVKITEIEDKKIICEITEKHKSDTEPNIEVTLFQGLPKASKMDYIIQKPTELGITRFVPCKLLRCVTKLENQKAEMKKTERWQKIAEAAAKQSGRGIVPKIVPPMTLEQVIEEMRGYDICFAPYECEEKKNLRSVLRSKSEIKRAAYIIGPEGGFAPSEIDKITSAGIDTVTLGKRILRTETAGEAVLSMIMYEIGDINE